MNYQEEYKQKLTTAEEAVKVVKSGDWVDYTWCTSHPVELDKALAARKDELTDVKVRGGVTMWMPEICKAEVLTVRSLPRAWVILALCVTLSFLFSIVTILLLWMW